MILKIKSWCEELTIAVVISIIIEMMIPEGSNKKYSKVITGIYILFIMISPIIELTSENYEINIFKKYNFEETSANISEEIKDLYIIRN